MNTRSLSCSYLTCQRLLTRLTIKFYYPALKNNTFSTHSTTFQWFRSYLLDHSQFVPVNGFSFFPSPLLCGVSQGSLLGPVLFVLLAEHFCSSTVKITDTEIISCFASWSTCVIFSILEQRHLLNYVTLKK